MCSYCARLFLSIYIRVASRFSMVICFHLRPSQLSQVMDVQGFILEYFPNLKLCLQRTLIYYDFGETRSRTLPCRGGEVSVPRLAFRCSGSTGFGNYGLPDQDEITVYR